MWQRNPLRKETKLILNDFGLRQKHFWNKHGYFCQFHLWCSKMHLPWYAKKCWVIYLFIIYRAHCSKTFFGRLWALHAISVFTHDASKGEKHVTSPKKFCIAMKCHDRMSWNDMTEILHSVCKTLAEFIFNLVFPEIYYFKMNISDKKRRFLQWFALRANEQNAGKWCHLNSDTEMSFFITETCFILKCVSKTW